MLKLRKILFYNQLYILVVIVVLLITMYRLNIPLKSNYTKNSNSFIGIVDKIIKKDNKITFYIKNNETIIAYYYLESNEKLKIHLGDKIKINGSFNLPNKNSTNYLFNYRDYLKRKNIFYLVDITSIEKVDNNHSIYYYLKQKLINNLNNNRYLYTFILGDKTYLDSNIKRSYQNNGISHLFAISGMHITMLVLIITKLLSRFKLDETTLFIITSFILIIYLLLVGLSPSILRAVLFYILFSLNRINYFYIKPTNLFFSILSISLLINPYYIYDLGYQYSYSISFALIKMSKYLNSNNYFISLFKVSLLALIVSIPITLYNFYMINILSVIYNLLFVPLISIIIFPMSLLVVFFKFLEPIYNLLINLLEALSIFINSFNLPKLVFKRLPIFIYLIYFVIIIIYLYIPKKILIYMFLFLLIIHYSIPYLDKSDYLKVIDVGQGDSILIHSNNKNVLIDTGGITTYKNNLDGVIFYNTLEPLLRSEGIKKLDYLILSHGDKDHLGEALTILKNMDVSKIYINQGRINYLEKEIIRKHKNTYQIKEGEVLTVGDISFVQLNKEFLDENDSSSIFLMNYKSLKILLIGDASKKSEEYILDNYEIGQIDILKLGHHGSKTSTSSRLLKETKPKIGLISCGKDNKFHHPNEEVIKRLNKYNVEYYRTDLLGTITINLNNKKIMMEG